MLGTTAQAVSSPTSGSDRRLDIQGLRAIAVIMVVVAHAGLPAPGGFVGVDVFFVISGFVITAMLLREWRATGTIAMRRFYVRRFKRLTPPLALMISLTTIGAALILPPFGEQQSASRTAIGAIGLVANFVIAKTTGGYFDAPARMNPLLHTWSLSVEEQFYMFFPALMLIMLWAGRKNGRSRILAAGAIVATIVLSCVAVGLSDRFAGNGTIGLLFGYYSPITRAAEFGIGALLALLPPVPSRPLQRLSGLVGLLGLGCLVASMWLITEKTPFPGPWTLLPVLGTTALILAGSAGQGPVTRLLSIRPMALVGDWSYSIYLWHWPFITVAAFVWRGNTTANFVAAVVSLLPALASYRWVETPFRHAPLATRRSLLVAVSACLVPPLLLGALSGWAARSRYWTPRIAQLETQMSYHLGYQKGCFGGDLSELRKPEECRLVTGSAARTLYLVGDSNADQFTEGLMAASEKMNRTFYSYTFGACPFADVRVPGIGEGNEKGCAQYKKNTLEWLATAQPGTVIIANSDYYFRDPTVELPNSSGPVIGVTAKLRLLGHGLANYVRTLQSVGHEVVLVKAIPSYFTGSWPETRQAWRGLQSCTNLELLTGQCMSVEPVAFDVFAERQAESWAQLDLVASETGATVLDLSTALCPDRRCSLWRGDQLLYWDPNHLTVGASYGLQDTFVAVFMNHR